MIRMAPGSSPLARGLRGIRPPPGSESGIIPARAGFTSPPNPYSPGQEDHPRSRGVYLAYGLGDLLAKGSSPLARGLHGVLLRRGVPARIIPARAGFTVNAIGSGVASADHPRSRGVYPP